MDLYWGLAFVFVVLVIEEIGLPLPFVSPGIMVALSIQWRLGLVPLWAILITAACASATGTLILYAAGIYGARPLLLRYGSWVRLPEPRLLDLENRIRVHAFWTILSARFIPGLTAVSSMLAGTLRIPVLVVLAAGQITSLTWTLFWLTVGNVVSDCWRHFWRGFRRNWKPLPPFYCSRYRWQPWSGLYGGLWRCC